MPGSFLDEVYRSTRDQLVRRYGPPAPAVAGPVPQHHQYLQLDWLIGQETWWIPDRKWVMSATIPPLATFPAVVSVTATWSFGSSLWALLEEIGAPLPEIDPTFICALSSGCARRCTAYLPGPPDLAELYYIASTEGKDVRIEVLTHMPPEPERTKIIERHRTTCDWQGTLEFESFEQLQAGDRRVKRHHPPGSERARWIIL